MKRTVRLFNRALTQQPEANATHEGESRLSPRTPSEHAPLDGYRIYPMQDQLIRSHPSPSTSAPVPLIHSKTSILRIPSRQIVVIPTTSTPDPTKHSVGSERAAGGDGMRLVWVFRSVIAFQDCDLALHRECQCSKTRLVKSNSRGSLWPMPLGNRSQNGLNTGLYLR